MIWSDGGVPVPDEVELRLHDAVAEGQGEDFALRNGLFLLKQTAGGCQRDERHFLLVKLKSINCRGFYVACTFCEFIHVAWVSLVTNALLVLDLLFKLILDISHQFWMLFFYLLQNVIHLLVICQHFKLLWWGLFFGWFEEFIEEVHIFYYHSNK